MLVAESAWNSLEVAKLTVGILTPLTVAVLGLVVARASKRGEEAAYWNRRAVERRIELHKEMAPLLNDLLCFFRTRGHFREITPPVLIERKRHLDRLYWSNKHLFSEVFCTAYQEFMRACFEEGGRAGSDAKIVADVRRQKEDRGIQNWDPEWAPMFGSFSAGQDQRQQEAHDKTMIAFADDLGLARRSSPRTATG